jgi:hypothetical protein
MIGSWLVRLGGLYRVCATLGGNKPLLESAASDSTMVPEYHWVPEVIRMSAPTKSGLLPAMAVFVVIAMLATFTLTGKMRIAVWIFLGGMAVKTFLSSLHQS